MVRAYSLPITLRGIRVTSHRLAGKMPAVRLRRACVVHVVAITFPIERSAFAWQHDLKFRDDWFPNRRLD